MPSKKSEALPFEKALQELTDIVQSMEDDELKLEDSLKKFERGVLLINQCQQSLKQAEQTVKLLTDRNQLTNFQVKEE